MAGSTGVAKQDVVGGVPVVPLFAEHDDHSSLAGVAAGLDPTGQLEEVWGVTSDNRVLRGRATGPYASGSLSLRAPERIGRLWPAWSVGPGQCPTIAGVDAEGGVFRCIKSSHWQQIGEGKAMLSVGRDQGLWMIDQDGTVCMKAAFFQVRPVTTLSKVTLKTGDRIALRSDNGKYLSRVTRWEGHVVILS